MQAIRQVTAGLNNAVGAFKHKKLSIMARGAREQAGEGGREPPDERRCIMQRRQTWLCCQLLTVPTNTLCRFGLTGVERGKSVLNRDSL